MAVSEAPAAKREEGIKESRRGARRLAGFLGPLQREPKPKKKSKMPPVPVKRIDGSVVVSRKGKYMYYVQLGNITAYDCRAVRFKQRKRDALAEVIASLPGRHVHLVGLNPELDAKKLDDVQSRHLVSSASDTQKRRHAKTRRRTSQQLAKKRYRERRVYLGVSLEETRPFAEQFGAWMAGLLTADPVANEAVPEELFAEQIKEFKALLKSKGVEFRPVDQSELVWMIQRSLLRGQDNLPDLGFDGEPISREADLVRLGRVVADDEVDHLLIDQLGERSYVTCLAVAQIPQPIPKTEWLFLTDQFGRPVEFSARIYVKPSGTVGAEARRRQTVLEGKMRELVKQKVATAARRRARHELDQNAILLDYADKGGHLVYTDVQLFLSDTSLERMKDTRSHIIGTYGSRGMKFDVDTMGQGDMWLSAYPGSDHPYDAHTLWMFPQAFATAMPHATSAFGNGGAFMGTVLGSERMPFLYSPHHAIKKENDHSVATVIVGPLGKGKTFLLLSFGAAAAKDGHIVILDENKGDTQKRLLEEIPLVPVTSIDWPDYPGVFNPGMLGETIEEKHDLMLDFLKMCSRGWKDDWEIDLDQEIWAELERSLERPNMMRIVENLHSQPKDSPANRLGGSLMSVAKSQHAPLFFSTEWHWRDIPDILQPGVMTIARFTGLAIPDSPKTNKDEYSNPERLAILARRLSNYLYALVSEDRDLPVTICKDEYHMDARLGGRTFVDHVARIGRAKQTTIIVASQSLEDFPDNSWEYVSTTIVLGSEDPDAALRAAKRLNLDVTTEPLQRYYSDQIMDLSPEDEPTRRGEAYVRIPGGRVAKVRFEDYQLCGAFVSNQEAALEREEARLRVINAIKTNGIIKVNRPATREGAIRRLASLNPARFGLSEEDLANNDHGDSAKVDGLVAWLMEMQEGQEVWAEDAKLYQVHPVHMASAGKQPVAAFAGEQQPEGVKP